MAQHQIDPNKWITQYSDYLFNYTITRVNDRVIAQDLVQETFLAGLKSMTNFKGESSERTWLIAILKRKIIDYCISNNINYLYTTAVSDYSRKIFRNKKFSKYAKLIAVKEEEREVYMINVCEYIKNSTK